jgi:hypothetical protein
VIGSSRRNYHHAKWRIGLQSFGTRSSGPELSRTLERIYTVRQTDTAADDNNCISGMIGLNPNCLAWQRICSEHHHFSTPTQPTVDPRRLFLRDLQATILGLQEKGHSIVLTLDANSTGSCEFRVPTRILRTLRQHVHCLIYILPTQLHQHISAHQRGLSILSFLGVRQLVNIYFDPARSHTRRDHNLIIVLYLWISTVTFFEYSLIAFHQVLLGHYIPEIPSLLRPTTHI